MTLSLSKKDIALRKLKTAILLFMKDEDFISSYSLAAASSEILREIWRKEINEPSFRMPFDIMLEGLSKNKTKKEKKEIWEKNNKVKNFFKHARNDTNSSIEYDDDLVIFLIWDAITTYSEIYKVNEASFIPFLFWVMSTQEAFKNTPFNENEGEMLRKLNIKEKKDFLTLNET